MKERMVGGKLHLRGPAGLSASQVGPLPSERNQGLTGLDQKMECSQGHVCSRETEVMVDWVQRGGQRELVSRCRP